MMKKIFRLFACHIPETYEQRLRSEADAFFMAFDLVIGKLNRFVSDSLADMYADLAFGEDSEEPGPVAFEDFFEKARAELENRYPRRPGEE